jgi:hypothetical protein
MGLGLHGEGVRDEDIHEEIGVSELYKIAGGSLVGARGISLHRRMGMWAGSLSL